MTEEKIVTRDEAWAALNKAKVKTYDTTFKLIFEKPDNIVRLYTELTNKQNRHQANRSHNFNRRKITDHGTVR